jgi:hypothetical protein
MIWKALLGRPGKGDAREFIKELVPASNDMAGLLSTSRIPNDEKGKHLAPT